MEIGSPSMVFILKGIRIGTGAKFIGIPFIYSFPDSKICIGKNVEIRSSKMSNFIGINRKTIISTQSKDAEIIIGNNCGMSGVVIGAKQSIIIGDNVMLGANVLITDFDWHPVNSWERRDASKAKSKPIKIEDNVFIGYSSTILKGTTIGENSVIGANSVVTSNIPPNVIAGGNPCLVLRKLEIKTGLE
ncbi:MAG: acyltransferase [Flavobacterium sp.]|nr:MAG: acyltransferase [Flavobacterium sp.]